jgi:hypothetical protein
MKFARDAGRESDGFSRLTPKCLPKSPLRRWFPGLGLPAVVRVAVVVDGAPYGLRTPTRLGERGGGGGLGSARGGGAARSARRRLAPPSATCRPPLIAAPSVEPASLPPGTSGSISALQGMTELAGSTITGFRLAAGPGAFDVLISSPARTQPPPLPARQAQRASPAASPRAAATAQRKQAAPGARAASPEADTPELAPARPPGPPMPPPPPKRPRASSRGGSMPPPARRQRSASAEGSPQPERRPQTAAAARAAAGKAAAAPKPRAEARAGAASAAAAPRPAAAASGSSGPAPRAAAAPPRPAAPPLPAAAPAPAADLARLRQLRDLPRPPAGADDDAYSRAACDAFSQIEAAADALALPLEAADAALRAAIAAMADPPGAGGPGAPARGYACQRFIFMRYSRLAAMARAGDAERARKWMSDLAAEAPAA